MSEIFTPKAKSAMVLAAREAILFKHQAVGTEHLLLGLILEQEGIAGNVLRGAGLTAEIVRSEIESLTGSVLNALFTKSEESDSIGY